MNLVRRNVQFLWLGLFVLTHTSSPKLQSGGLWFKRAFRNLRVVVNTCAPEIMCSQLLHSQRVHTTAPTDDVEYPISEGTSRAALLACPTRGAMAPHQCNAEPGFHAYRSRNWLCYHVNVITTADYFVRMWELTFLFHMGPQN